MAAVFRPVPRPMPRKPMRTTMANTLGLFKDADSAHSKLGLQPDSFDVFSSYPRPGEKYLIERLFEDGAANDACS